MTITIFMPVLDGTRFIGEAMASLEAQTDRDWRLVVLDGGSTDGTAEIVSRRAMNDARIELRSAPDDGQYDALLTGILATDCDYIGWLNADDLLPPWAIAGAKRAFAETGADWIAGLPALWDGEGALRAVYPVAGRLQGLIRRGWYHDGLLGCLQQESMFFRKQLIEGLTAEELGLIRNHRLAGDFQLWRSFARQTKLVSVPSVLGGFRRHGGNRSVTGADAYQKEVHALGGVTLPIWFARPVRSLHDYFLAVRTVRAARRAAHRLAADE